MRATTGAEVVIVGAGPAGSVAAVAALRVDPSLRVVLLDRATFPRDKCCGDGIAAQAVDVLATLGMHDVVDGWAPLRRLELAVGDVAVDGAMNRDVHVIPRSVLDARLVDHAVRAGADLRRRRVTDLADVDDLADPGARVVVGADGAHSRVRATLAATHHLPAPRRAMALRGYAPTPAGNRGRQVIRYGPRRQPSYAWAFDRGDGLSNVGYGELVDGPRVTPQPLTRADMLAQLEELLPGSTDGATDWRGHHLPLSGARWHQPDGACLLAGDAAGLVNPMTGEGIYYAVATGALAGRTAAEAVLAGRPEQAGARYRHVVRRLLAPHLRHTWAAGTLSRQPRFVAAGIRAADADQRVFDDLVEIGLGGGRITPRLSSHLVRELARDLLPVRRRPDPARHDPAPRPVR